MKIIHHLLYVLYCCGMANAFSHARLLRGCLREIMISLIYQLTYTAYILNNPLSPSSRPYRTPHFISLHSPSAVCLISISLSSATSLSSIPPPSTGNNSPNRTTSSAGHTSVSAISTFQQPSRGNGCLFTENPISNSLSERCTCPASVRSLCGASAAAGSLNWSIIKRTRTMLGSSSAKSPASLAGGKVVESCNSSMRWACGAVSLRGAVT